MKLVSLYGRRDHYVGLRKIPTIGLPHPRTNVHGTSSQLWRNKYPKGTLLRIFGDKFTPTVADLVSPFVNAISSNWQDWVAVQTLRRRYDQHYAET